jgi:hypothetical protein
MNVHKAIHGRLVLLVTVVLVLTTLVPIGATLAQQGKSYRLTTTTSPAGEGVSSGGNYVLTKIDTRPSPSQSQADGYALAPFTPQEPLADVCVYLPLVLRKW